MPISERPRYAAGDVVVVPFPYADRLAEKRRPALVVSGPQLARFGLQLYRGVSRLAAIIGVYKRRLFERDIEHRLEGPIEDGIAGGIAEVSH